MSRLHCFNERKETNKSCNDQIQSTKIAGNIIQNGILKMSSRSGSIWREKQMLMLQWDGHKAEEGHLEHRREKTENRKLLNLTLSLKAATYSGG